VYKYDALWHAINTIRATKSRGIFVGISREREGASPLLDFIPPSNVLIYIGYPILED